MQVKTFSTQIDITNGKMINSYGASAQRHIAETSAVILEQLKISDFGAVGACLDELCDVINSTVPSEKKGILRFFWKRKQKSAELRSNYEKAEEKIKTMEQKLQRYRQNLTKDIYIFEQLQEENQEFYEEVTMYLEAGQQALERAQKKLLGLQEEAEDTQKPQKVQEYNVYEAAYARFEKKLLELETSRQMCIQTTHQLRLLQNSNREMVNKLRANVIHTIPLWRSQMALAFGMEQIRTAAAITEKSVIDLENVKKTNVELMTSIHEVIKLYADDSQCRRTIQEKLIKLKGA